MSSPSFIVEVPGRVNLIGEHVDHQGYPVCPCAIKQSLKTTVSYEPKTSSNNFLSLCNSRVDLFPPKSYKTVQELKLSGQKEWNDYCIAAYLGIVEYVINGHSEEKVGTMLNPHDGLSEAQVQLAQNTTRSPLHFSFTILVEGTVPLAAGLSSSAALVVAISYSIAHVCLAKFPGPERLAELCARSERYNGVASGGMDQAACLLSREGSATLIRFNPLRTWHVSLPRGASLVVVNSCRLAPKAKYPAKMYNKRVFELKVGCLALLKWFQNQERASQIARSLTGEELLNLQLCDVVRRKLCLSEERVLAILPSILKSGAWTKLDVSEVLSKEHREILLQRLCGKDVWHTNEDFDVSKRCRHVLSEACRVEEFARVCVSMTMPDNEKMERLGELMNASGVSMRDDFDATCPEIDEIVLLAQQNGALGARVTGAGWGGCVVCLVPDERVNTLIHTIKEEYFSPIYRNKRTVNPPLETLPDEADLDLAIFSTWPSQGAHLIRLTHTGV